MSEKNPLLQPFNTKHRTTPFSNIKEEHYKEAFLECLSRAKEEVNEIANNDKEPTFENTIEALERAGDVLGRVSSIFFNLTYADTSDFKQKLSSEIAPLLSEFSNDIYFNEKLFERVEKVRESVALDKLNAEKRMLLDKTYKAFRRNGVNLPEKEKAKFREISKRLSELTVLFGQNVLAETNDFSLHLTDERDLEGLPESDRETASETAQQRGLSGWVFTLQFPSYLPFMKYAKNRELRKQMFIAYASRCNKGNDKDNKEVIKEIVGLRLQKAKLLGYETYSHLILEERMAKTPQKVFSFLNELFDKSFSFAVKEKEELDFFAKSKGLKDSIQRWDWAFYAEKLREEKYSISEEEVKPYFKLENVINGVLGLATKLYGLTFKQVHDIDIYHRDVKTFEVYDSENILNSVLYLDFHPRETKQGGAWMTSFVDQHVEDCEDVRPHVSLVCNFTKPTNTKPSLLTFEEVETFLHEFGHGLHGMLSKCTYESLSGTNVYRDFVELPSQIMENWALEEEWLREVAFHYETGEIIPQEIVDKLIASKNFHSAYQMVRQLSFGYCDMSWHSIMNMEIGDVKTFEIKALAKTELFPDVEEACFSTSFSHIFSGGYAAGYYGYKWAEVLDADAFSVFKSKGIFNREIAHSFRENILQRGGTEHPDELYKKFRGAEPSIDHLLERSGLK